MFRAVNVLLLILVFGHSLYAELPMNVLIIQTDEHNFRTLGCYRETLPPDLAQIWGPAAIVETPAIDSIAERGAICTSFYATSPVCTPSRAAFFTGRYPHHTGAAQNDKPLSSDMVTFASVLKEQGYATGYAGKWHLDGPGKPQWQPRRTFGFDDNRFMFNRGHWKHFQLTEQGPVIASLDRKGNPSYALGDANAKTFSTDWLTDRAIDFIREHHQQPFCYHLSLPDPHGPNTVRAPYDSMYADMVVRPPPTFRKPEHPAWAPPSGKNGTSKFNPNLMTLYFGMVKCIDDNVTRLLEVLEEFSLTNRTMVVFTSDHGDLCYEHGRLNKGVPYEASAKIPMVIAAPGKVPPRTRVDAALGTVDFLPTMLSILGFPVPASTQGRDASMLLTNSAKVAWNDVAILRSAGTKPGWIAAITNEAKLILAVNERPYLIDLVDDPHELENRIDEPQYRSTIRKLADELARYGEQFDDPHLKSPKINADLQSLIATHRDP